jgi:outer membrane beta-barrel protein
MEGRIFRFFLNVTAIILFVPGPPFTLGYAREPEQVVRPELERRPISKPDIDTENFEIGVFAGAMSVEDFGTNVVYGARLAYHVTEDVFAESAYGRTETDQSSAERFGGFEILTGSERTLEYYNLSFGFNLLAGESFLATRWAYASDLYAIAGVGSTSFAGDDLFTWNFGVGYRVLLNDWLALRIDGRDHVFDLDLLGESQTNHNLEFTGGVSLFF